MKDESSSSSPAYRPSTEIQPTLRPQTSLPTQPTDRRLPLLDQCCRQLKRPRLQLSPCSFCSHSIDRHQRRSFSEASALGPRASPPRLMDNSTASMDKAILSSLKIRMKPGNSSMKKLPTDTEVMQLVLRDVSRSFQLDLALLKGQIKKYESMVRNHLDSGEDIGENEELLLTVFRHLRLSTHRRGKLIRPLSGDGHDGSSYLEHAKKATYSESVGKQSTGSASAQNETEKSAIVMQEVSKKLETSLAGPLLYKGLDMAKEDMVVRYTLHGLSEQEAGKYIKHLLNKWLEVTILMSCVRRLSGKYDEALGFQLKV